MPLPKPFPGLVVHYSYLWRDQWLRGREEGVKDRPCVIVATEPSANGEVLVTLAPITHSPPRSPEPPIELPLAVKRLLQMDDQRSWIVVTDLNSFYWAGEDLRSVPGKPPGHVSYGVLPPGLFRQVRNGILRAAALQPVAPTPR